MLGWTTVVLPCEEWMMAFMRLGLFVCLIFVFVWSALEPFDRLVWWLEVFPVLIVVPLLLVTHKKFPLTPLLYGFILLHLVILLIGGHFTYERVPAFDWLKETFGFARNHYDRLGHFAQGFVPAVAAREILLRFEVVHSRRWLNFLVVCVCLAVSAFYELIEWWAAVALGEGANAFLGTQGDVWDTQVDMFCALLGAISALSLFSRLHDKQIQSISPCCST